MAPGDDHRRGTSFARIMTGTTILSAVAMLAFVAVACDQGAAPHVGASTTSAQPPVVGSSQTGADERAGTSSKAVRIDKFGLTGAVASATAVLSIEDGVGGWVLASFADFAVTIGVAQPSDPQTAKDAEQRARESHSPSKLQTETLPDGWALTYEYAGPYRANLMVEVRRELGGTAYLCNAMNATPEQQKASLAFCKSLTK